MNTQKILPPDKDVEEQSSVNIQTNIINIAQYVDIDKLEHLNAENPRLADRYMSMLEDQLKQASKTEDSIMELEKQEQKLRATELPCQRSLFSKSLYFSTFMGFASLGVATFALHLGYPWVAGLSISIPVGILAVNLLGIKNKDQN